MDWFSAPDYRLARLIIERGLGLTYLSAFLVALNQFPALLGQHGLLPVRGDPCWRDLTCMDYHHETQPMPNPLSWFVHRLPRGLHRSEVIGNFVAQLLAPVLLFLPQPIAGVGALIMIGTQGYLIVSGNYA